MRMFLKDFTYRIWMTAKQIPPWLLLFLLIKASSPVDQPEHILVDNRICVIDVHPSGHHIQVVEK